METVSRKHVSLADNKELFKAIAEAQERIEVDLRLYEKELWNPEAKKLRARKEGMDRSKGRLSLQAGLRLSLGRSCGDRELCKRELRQVRP